MIKLSSSVNQFPHRVQMQRDSSIYLYVESFHRCHSEPNDHYIELTAENYQAALTQDWLRQYRQCMSKPGFSSAMADNFIKLQIFVFMEDDTPPVLPPAPTYVQAPVEDSPPQVAARAVRTLAAQPPYILTPSEARNATPSAGALQKAGTLLDKAIEQCIIPDLGERARTYLLTQVALRPSTALVDLVVLINTLDVKTLIAHDKMMVILERWSRMDEKERKQQQRRLEQLQRLCEQLEQQRQQQRQQQLQRLREQLEQERQQQHQQQLQREEQLKQKREQLLQGQQYLLQRQQQQLVEQRRQEEEQRQRQQQRAQQQQQPQLIQVLRHRHQEQQQQQQQLQRQMEEQRRREWEEQRQQLIQWQQKQDQQQQLQRQMEGQRRREEEEQRQRLAQLQQKQEQQQQLQLQVEEQRRRELEAQQQRLVQWQQQQQQMMQILLHKAQEER
ncbi:hypothetical protein BGZ52_000843 [Haplosporangium bisporale]|nr:hypothetical protein BGZ52_000843 [Haplosporangium bisporale]